MSVYKRFDSPFCHYNFQWRHFRFHGSTGELIAEGRKHSNVPKRNALGSKPLLESSHVDIKTTMRYAHALVDDVAEAMSMGVIDEVARRSAHESRIKSRENPEQCSEEVDKKLKKKEK